MFLYEFSDNWAAVVGCVFCFVMLLVWLDRDSITLTRGKRDWEG